MIETTSRICHKFAVTPVFSWSRKQALLLHFSVFQSLCLFSANILCLGDLFASHLFCCFPLPWTWPSRMLPFVRDSRCQQHPIRLYRKAALTAAAARLAVRVTRSSQTLRPLLEQGQGNMRRGRAFFTLPLLAFLLLFPSRQPVAPLRCSRALCPLAVPTAQASRASGGCSGGSGHENVLQLPSCVEGPAFKSRAVTFLNATLP